MLALLGGAREGCMGPGSVSDRFVEIQANLVSQTWAAARMHNARTRSFCTRQSPMFLAGKEGWCRECLNRIGLLIIFIALCYSVIPHCLSLSLSLFLSLSLSLMLYCCLIVLLTYLCLLIARLLSEKTIVRKYKISQRGKLVDDCGNWELRTKLKQLQHNVSLADLPNWRCLVSKWWDSNVILM